MKYYKPEINIEMFLSEDILTTSSAGEQNKNSNHTDALNAINGISSNDKKIAEYIFS